MQVPAAFASEKSAPQGSGSKEEPPAAELVAVVKRDLSDGTTLFCFGTKEEADAVKEAEAEEAKALEAEALKEAEAEEAKALEAEALKEAEAEEAKALEAESLKEAEADDEVNAPEAEEEEQPDPGQAGSSNNGALAAETNVEEAKEEKVKEERKDEAAGVEEASSKDLSQELVGHLNDLVDAIDNHMLAEAAAAAKDTNGGSMNHASVAAASKAADEESTTAAVATEEVVQEQPGNAEEVEEEVEEVVEEEVSLWDRCPREAVLGAVYGTDRGLDATADTRARLEEALGKLEATNEQPRPSQTMPLLAGRWKLVYTNTPQALAILGALRALPVVTIGDITQHVDGNSLEVQNKVEVAVPFMLSLSAHAGFEVRSPRMLKLKYHKAKMDSGVSIATPQLFAGLEVPEELSILGQTLDLRPLRAALDPVLQTVQSVSSTVTAPEMEAPQPLPSSYRVITYLDSGLQVSRDHNGGVFVMVKDEGFFDIPRVGFR